MNARPSIFFLLRQFVTILLTSGYPGNKWLNNTHKKACEKLGKALNISLHINKLRWQLNGIFTIDTLQIQKEHTLSFTATDIHGKVNFRTLRHRKNLLRSLSVASIQLDILAADRPAPKNTATANAPVFPLQARHYKTAFRLLNRLKNHLPYHTSFAIATLTAGRHTASVKKGIISNQNGILFCSAGETRLPGIAITGTSTLLNITDITDHTFLLHAMIDQGVITSRILSSNEIKADHLSLQTNCMLSEEAFTLAETTVVRYDKLRFPLSARHDFSHHQFKAGIRLEETTIADFLQTFSDFSYRKIYHLSFTGTVAGASAQFTCNTINLWEHTFTLDLQRNQLQLTGYPEDWHNLHGQPVTRGDHYLDIRQTQPLLLATILSAEDTSFFKHRGLDATAIGYSIIQNIINRGFHRGASTITMQLVRNLFLNHEKTVYRKIEEVFIALLLEHFFRIPKMKILEHYLNIIEMGPDVYNVANASWFYFSKQVNELSFTECLVLSYIIPRPKFFLNAFMNESAQLKRNLATHIKRFGRVLFLQGIVTQEQYDGLDMNITIQGKTLSLLQPAGA